MPLQRACAVCGTPFFAAAYLVRRGQGRYCSRTCAGKKHGRGPVPVETRLLAHRRIDPETGCWLWTGMLREGYPVITVDGKLKSVQRAAAAVWLDFDASAPAAVRLTCKQPRCFNPDHLRLPPP